MINTDDFNVVSAVIQASTSKERKAGWQNYSPKKNGGRVTEMLRVRSTRKILDINEVKYDSQRGVAMFS
jgi:hypothetical protein